MQLFQNNFSKAKTKQLLKNKTGDFSLAFPSPSPALRALEVSPRSERERKSPNYTSFQLRGRAGGGGHFLKEGFDMKVFPIVNQNLLGTFQKG